MQSFLPQKTKNNPWLCCITDGKIDNDMLEATKKTIISSIMASSDTSIGTINAAFSKIFVGFSV